MQIAAVFRHRQPNMSHAANKLKAILLHSDAFILSQDLHIAQSPLERQRNVPFVGETCLNTGPRVLAEVNLSDGLFSSYGRPHDNCEAAAITMVTVE